MSIHSRIKERRLALGLESQQALAQKIGVSWQTVQLWEKEGGTAPNRNRLAKVAEVLGVTEEWLISGRGNYNRDDKIVGPEPLESPPPRMRLHYISKEEERILELYRLSTERGQKAIVMAAEGSQKALVPDIIGYKS